MLKRARLFDVEAKERRLRTCTDLVAVDLANCPECGAGTVPMVAHQPALFRHGGYGATAYTVTLHCLGVRCSWAMETERTEVSPRS